MHVRRSKKKRVDGTERVDVSLAHNVRVANADGERVTKPIVLAHLGSLDDLDDGLISSAIAALTRFREKLRRERGEAGLPVESAATEAARLREIVRPHAPMLRVMTSKAFGLRMVVEAAWAQLGFDKLFREIEAKAHLRMMLERMVFAMVWNRLESPKSKLSCVEWLTSEAWMPEAADWDADKLYRAMDAVYEHRDVIVAKLRELARVPLDNGPVRVLIDTTTIFTEADVDDVARAEIDEAWRAFREGRGEKPSQPLPQVVNEPPLRMRGKSKDGHPESPQIVLGLATTQHGDVTGYTLDAGNTSDKRITARLLKDTLSDLPEADVLAVMDAGMAGVPNLKWLASHGERVGWLAAMPVRRNKAVAHALAAGTTWETFERTSHRDKKPKTRTWSAKLVELPEALRAVRERPERVLLLRNPEREERDLRKLDRQVSEVKEALKQDDQLTRGGRANPLAQRAALAGLWKVSDDKTTMVLDDASIARERAYAGLRALRTTDTKADGSAIVDGYQNLLGTEEDFRTLKSALEIRPFWHRSRERIEAHALICLLALTCLRHVERRTGERWSEVERSFSGVRATQMSAGSGTWWQRTELGPKATTLLKKLGAIPGYERWTSDATLPVRAEG